MLRGWQFATEIWTDNHNNNENHKTVKRVSIFVHRPFLFFLLTYSVTFCFNFPCSQLTITWEKVGRWLMYKHLSSSNSQFGDFCRKSELLDFSRYKDFLALSSNKLSPPIISFYKVSNNQKACSVETMSTVNTCRQKKIKTFCWFHKIHIKNYTQ